MDTTNLSDVSLTPDALEQGALRLLTDSIKPDRSGEDLLFQVLLGWGLGLAMPIAAEVIGGHSVYVVDGDALVACFDAGISDSLVHAIAELHPLRAVFRDSGFVNDAARINTEQVFRELSPETEVRTI